LSILLAAGALAFVGYFIFGPRERPAPEPATGILALHVTPPGATVLLDGDPIGPADGFRQAIKPGSHEIEARADGYQSRREMVTVPASGEKSLELALVPPTGILVLRVSPPEAVLRLDGKPVGSANFRQEIQAGTHELELSAEGHQGRRETVTVPAGGERSFDLALVKVPPPAPTTGTLAVHISPPEAVLTLDGKPAGSAADFRQEVAPGTHELEFSAEGYQSRHETVTVPAGGEKDMELALASVPPSPPTAGTLELEVSPGNAMLKLDGAWVGNANGFSRELPAGKHPAEISAPGYQALAGDLVVEAGKMMHRRFDLVAVPQPPRVPKQPPPQVVVPRPRPQPEPSEPPRYQREPMPAVAPSIPRTLPQYIPAAPTPSVRPPPMQLPPP
jgi:hypothetical protein